MPKRSRFRRTFPVGACAAATILNAAAADGNDKARVACQTAYKDYKTALANEQSGQLRSARDLYESCSHATCAGLVQKCSAKYSAMRADMPSIVPVVTDESGEPRVDLQVKVDGEVVTSRLDGRGIAVDPGLHEFTFLNEAGGSATQKVMVIEGQKNRPLAVTVHWPTPTPTPTKRIADKAAEKVDPPSPESVPPHEAPPDSAPPKEGPSLVVPVAIGGAGVLALAAGGLLTYWGRRDNDALSQCAPNCASSSINHIRTLYTLSDVSFGVGVGAVAVAASLWFWSRSNGDAPPARTACTFDVGASPTGAVASLRGAF